MSLPKVPIGDPLGKSVLAILLIVTLLQSCNLGSIAAINREKASQPQPTVTVTPEPPSEARELPLEDVTPEGVEFRDAAEMPDENSDAAHLGREASRAAEDLLVLKDEFVAGFRNGLGARDAALTPATS